MNNSIKSVNVI